jgi:hypothetical protein
LIYGNRPTIQNRKKSRELERTSGNIEAKESRKEIKNMLDIAATPLAVIA